MAELKDWATSAASNNSTPPDGAPEGMAPSAVNDVMRENMAVLARWKGDNDGSLTTGGSSNAYTLTPNGTYSAYAQGDTFTVEANHTNTGAATLNVSGLGAKSIRFPDNALLTGGEIVSGGVYMLVYDGSVFQITNPSGGSLPNGGDKFSINPGGAVSSPGGTFGFNFGNTVSSSATVTQDVDAASGGRWIGVVLVGSTQVSNSNNREDAIIYITDDGQATLSSNSNGSGSSFTLAYASGTLTLTNTSGGSAHMSMTVLGGGRTF